MVFHNVVWKVNALGITLYNLNITEKLNIQRQ